MIGTIRFNEKHFIVDKEGKKWYPVFIDEAGIKALKLKPVANPAQGGENNG